MTRKKKAPKEDPITKRVNEMLSNWSALDWENAPGSWGDRVRYAYRTGVEETKSLILAMVEKDIRELKNTDIQCSCRKILGSDMVMGLEVLKARLRHLP